MADQSTVSAMGGREGGRTEGGGREVVISLFSSNTAFI